MLFNRLIKIVAFCLGLLLLISISSPSATAGRYVLNQSPKTIETYFAKPIADIKYTASYSTSGLHRLFPDFPQDGEFKITFVNNQSQEIRLEPHSTEDKQFSYNKDKAAKFFAYIFGYNPSIWKDITPPFSGGEGFKNYTFCLGDGVATSFTSYRLGEDNISLSYNRACEPPY
ncbi:MAG TPA: hypothetical protein V6D11_00930 [Waterburya sp.]|jgi:hypothetical protein